MQHKDENRKWYIWGILVLAFIFVFFHRLAISVMADDLTRDLGLNGTLLGNLTSMNYYAYALMQIPVGILVDIVGVRRICTWGTLLAAFGSILFGMASSLYIAYISRFLVGIGTSVIIISILKVQALWFRKEEFSTLSGYTSFFGNTGAFLATFPLAFLVLSIGWRNSFYFIGLMSILIAIGIWIIVKDHPSQEASAAVTSSGDIIKGVKAVILNPFTWPPFVVMFTMVGGTTAIIGLWGMPYLMQVYEITKSQAAGYLSFVSLGFMLGSPLVGKLSYYLKGEIKKILLVATACYTGVWVLFILFNGKPPIALIPVLFFFIGFSTVGHILVFTNVKDVNDSRFAGSAAAIINVGEFVGGSALSFFIGFLLDKGWGGISVDGVKRYSSMQYRNVFAIIVLMGAISIIAALALKGKEVGKEVVDSGDSIGI